MSVNITPDARPILIMAGGTGGHIFPALAVASYLRDQGVDVKWLGTRQGLEADIVPQAGFDISYISISGLRGKGMLSWLLAPFKLMVAMLQSLKVLLKIRPAAVLGVGGFVTGPGGVMSFLLGRPLVIHEQNAIAGLTNRILSHLAQRVLEAFPSTFTKGPKVLNPGNPVRTEITSLAAPEQRFAGRDDAPIRLLVLGGSLGAKALNETLPAALAAMPDADRPIVRHQSGRRNIEEARQAYLAAGAKAEVLPFISDMAEAYSWADLVLCRAGALTVSELAAVGVGAILVPYPYAVDDHQTANARYLTEKGAARLLDQKELTPVTLCTLLKELLTGDKTQVRARLLMMAQAAKSLALPDATQRTAEQVLEVAYG